jgi:tetratricopeptide (TPR) repeat protein
MVSTISIRLNAKGGAYTATITTPAGSYDIEAPNALGAVIREDMRNLRWKAIGLRDPGDSILTEAGTRIGKLLFPEPRRAIWNCLEPGEAKQIVVAFAPGTEELFQVPWELMVVNGAFLLADQGSHLVREWGRTAHPASAAQPVNVLYVSFASDSSLDFQRERKTIDAAIPTSAKLSFLANPSQAVLTSTLNRLKPSVLHIASHGSYDFIGGSHTVDVGNGQFVPLQMLMELLSDHVPEVLVLGICESARLSSDIGFQMPEAKNPKNIVGYSYPVLDHTAIESTRAFYEGLARGKPLSRIMADVRGLSLADPFTFFNLVHYRLEGAPDCSWVAEPKKLTNTRAPGPMLIGRDSELGAITESVLTHELTTVLAPRGFGGSTLIEAWSWMNGHSAADPVPFIREPNLERLRELLRAQGTAKQGKKPLVVVDDPTSALTKADLNGIRILRSVEIAAYKPIEGESTILLRELDADAASLLARILLKGSSKVPKRGLGLVPGVIRQTASSPGMDLAAAEKWFDTENRMSQRFAALKPEGKRVGSLLAAVGGSSQLNTEGDMVETAYDMSGDSLSKGIQNALQTNVIVRTAGEYSLAPDFRLLREKWFPRYAEENMAVLTEMFRVAMTLMTHPPVDDGDAQFATRALLMAVVMGRLDYAMDLFARLIPWYSDRGRLEQLLTIAKLLRNQTGMEGVVAQGTIAKILTEQSLFHEALKSHQEMELRLKGLQGEAWYEQNLIASLTGQVDCLTNLGMAPEAFEKLKEAAAVARMWKDPLPDIRPRILAQLGELQLYRGNAKEARSSLTEAVRLAEKADSASLLADVLYTKAKILWQLDENDEAEALLERIQGVIDIEEVPRLYPQVLDLQAKLMAKRKDPKAIDFLLESYELDLAALDYRGAALSLISLIELYVNLGELDLAELRLNELEKLVNDHSIETERGAVKFYRGAIYSQRGDKEKARTSFLLAEKLDLQIGQLRHAALARARAEECL